MIRIPVTPELRAKAMEIAKPLMEQYKNNPKSIRKGEGIYYAKIAELAVSEKFGWKHIDTFHADTEAVLVNNQKRKIEIKAKERTVPPMGNYNATVAAANTKQACDYYLFCSTVRDEEVYVVSIIPKKDFLKNATFRKKSELDPDGPRGQNWKFRADCYNMPYNHEAMHQVGNLPLSD
jgi:hypothetical protein